MKQIQRFLLLCVVCCFITINRLFFIIHNDISTPESVLILYLQEIKLCGNICWLYNTTCIARIRVLAGFFVGPLPYR